MEADGLISREQFNEIPPRIFVTAKKHRAAVRRRSSMPLKIPVIDSFLMRRRQMHAVPFMRV